MTYTPMQDNSEDVAAGGDVVRGEVTEVVGVGFPEAPVIVRAAALEAMAAVIASNPMASEPSAYMIADWILYLTLLAEDVLEEGLDVVLGELLVALVSCLLWLFWLSLFLLLLVGGLFVNGLFEGGLPEGVLPEGGLPEGGVPESHNPSIQYYPHARCISQCFSTLVDLCLLE